MDRQCEIIAQLASHGLDATGARAPLAIFRVLQEAHVAHRDRLLSELKEYLSPRDSMSVALSSKLSERVSKLFREDT